MSIRTKTIAAAAIAAAAVPTAAVAHDRGHDREAKHDKHEQRDVRHAEHGRDGHEARRNKHRGHDHGRHEARSEKRRSGRHHKRRSHHKRGWRRAFVVFGTDLSGLSVNDRNQLAGPLTLDPVMANRHARRVLGIDRKALRGEDTVTFGTAGDEVRVRYKGLEAGDAIQPTDRVFVFGRFKRDDNSLDLRWIKVWRPGGDHDDD